MTKFLEEQQIRKIMQAGEFYNRQLRFIINAVAHYHYILNMALILA